MTTTQQLLRDDFVRPFVYMLRKQVNGIQGEYNLTDEAAKFVRGLTVGDVLNGMVEPDINQLGTALDWLVRELVAACKW